VLIADWGVVSSHGSDFRDAPFVAEIGELVYDGSRANPEVAVALASTPGDFEEENEGHTSDPYRGMGLWLDLGPLSEDDLEAALMGPTEARGMIVADPHQALQALKTYSTRDPYAASLMLARAFDAAQMRFEAAKKAAEEQDGRKDDPTAPKAVMTVDDLTAPEILAALTDIYAVHLPYTYRRLSAKNRQQLRAEAGLVRRPWENGKVAIATRDDQRQWSVFGRAGFRVPDGTGRNPEFNVWLPWGLATLISRYDEGEEGDNV
jgi:hypothetical protein